MRIFISIDPDREAAAKALEISNEIRSRVSSEIKGAERALKWEPSDKFHLTLFFIGEVNEALHEEIDASLSLLAAEMKSFCAKLETVNVNAFPNLKFPRVLVLEFRDPEEKVYQLSDNVRKSLKKSGLHADKPFRPHLTLARVRRDTKLSINNVDLSFNKSFSFKFSSICLYKSELTPRGSVYTKLKEYRF